MSNYYIPNERLNLIPERQIAHYLVTFKAGEDEAIEIRSSHPMDDDTNTLLVKLSKDTLSKYGYRPMNFDAECEFEVTLPDNKLVQLVKVTGESYIEPDDADALGIAHEAGWVVRQVAYSNLYTGNFEIDE